MRYKNLGIVEDVQGYVAVHKTALRYDFETFVGGHVGWLGTRLDVESSLEFVNDLRSAADAALDALSFPAFLASHAGSDRWALHNDYEQALVERCAARLGPTWEKRLTDTSTYLKDNCWVMIEAVIVQLPPRSGRKAGTK